MSIREKRIELTSLIDNIKRHSDHLSTLDTVPLLELSVILSKIGQLHEKAAVLKYVSARDQDHEKEESTLSEPENPSMVVESVEEAVIKPSEETLPIEKTQDLEGEDYVNVEQEESIETEEASQEGVSHEIVSSERIEEEITEETIEEEEEINGSTNHEEEELSEKELTSTEESQEAYTPSETILDSILEEVREEELDPLGEHMAKPQVDNDPLDEELIEKIEHETELDAVPDLNESLSEKDESISNQLQQQPITDLMTAIGLNERYLYSNELFNGDMDEFKNAITMLNEFKSGEEARAFFENGLRASYGWEDDNILAQALFSLVERRFQ